MLLIRVVLCLCVFIGWGPIEKAHGKSAYKKIDGVLSIEDVIAGMVDAEKFNFSREATNISLQTVIDPKASFRFGMLGHSPLTHKVVDGAHTFSVKWKGGNSVFCSLATERQDAAAIFVDKNERFADSDSVNGVLSWERESHIHKEIPYFIGQLLYNKFPTPGVITGDGSFGLYKTAVISMPNYTIWCEHDAAGYRESFERNINAIIELLSNDYVEQVKEIAARSVLLHYVEGRSVGWTELFYNGNSRVEERYVYNVVADRKDGGVNHRSEATVDLYDKNDILVLRKFYQDMTGAEKQLEYTLLDGGQYAVKGKFKGSELNKKVDTGNGQGLRRTTVMLRELLAGKTDQMLIPTLSPSGIRYSRYSVVDRSIGKIRMDAKVPTTLVVDQCGMLQELFIEFSFVEVLYKLRSKQRFGKTLPVCAF